MRASLLAIALIFLPGAAHAQEPGTQTPQRFEKQITRTVNVRYFLYLPKEYGKEAGKKWPLIVFLHGAGERGDDLEKVKAHGPPKLVSQGKEFPFIIISPQCPEGTRGWDNDTLMTLLDEISGKYAVDADRVYLTGLSMGGYGTWSLAMAYPERFAAIAPIAAGGEPRGLRRLKGVPAWVFHGAKDPVVPIKADQDMVDALKAAGGDVKFTIYPEAEHDSWTATYDNPDLYTWFLDHKRHGAAEAK